MKKTLSVLFALFISCITASAQIQNGYVRSQGTSYNRTGSPLKGARVFVKGLNGSKVTAPNGTFNFNLGGGKTQFSISSVTLKGYTLLSPLAPAYNVGKIAVEIVMQSREERIQNEARISKVIEERITKSYNAKTRELQKKITTLEKALSDKKKNSDELEAQIRSLKEQLGNLDNQYLKRNELIDKMVEEYVNLDYATMNNRKAELCSYIETGELEKADSLLNTIDINKEMNDIKTLNRDIEEKESMLAKEKEIRKNKIETACMYWRGKYDIAIQNMQYDSAAVYVKHLADVDTCNFQNVFECAAFLYKQNRYKEAEEYYIKILKKIEQESNSNKNIRLDKLYNNLALLYSNTQRFKESEDMHKAAIDIQERLVKENPKAYEPYLAGSYNNLAILYKEIQRLDESEKMLKAAIEIQERLVKDNPKAYEPNLAMSYNNLAILYNKIQRLDESEKMHKAAIEIWERLVKDNPKAYEPYLAMSYDNLASLYVKIQRFDESEKIYKAAIEIKERFAKENLKAYEPDLAMSYYNLASLYYKIQRFDESEKTYKAAIEIWERLAKDNPKAYEPYLAVSYNNFANLYDKIQRHEESENMYMAAIEIQERLVKDDPKAYEPALADSYNNLADLYNEIQRHDESEKIYKAAIEICERLVKENPKAYEPDLAGSYNNLAILYKKIQRFDESEKMYKAAIEIRERLAKENPKAYEPYLVSSYNDLAFVYYETEQFKESEKTYKKAISIYEQLYENNPQEYQKVLALNCYLLATIMIKNNKNHDVIVQFERSLKLCNNINKDEFDMSLYTSSLCYLVDLYYNEKDYTKAYSYNAVLLPLLKVNYEENAQRWKTEYNNKALNQSFYANLLGKFKEGEQYSLEAIKVDSTKHIAYTNLAAALLFQGKVIEAEKLYLEYKDEFKNTFIDDFAEFERLGVIPEERKADVERIKAILNE